MTVCQNLEEALKSNYRLYLRTCKGKIFAIVDKYNVEDKAGNSVGTVCELITMTDYFIRHGLTATEFLMDLVNLDKKEFTNYGDSLFVFTSGYAVEEGQDVIDITPKNFMDTIKNYYDENICYVADDQTTGYYTIMK